MNNRLSIISWNFSRPLKNVFEAADTRQKQAKKRSLCVINEHFKPVFNTVAATQIVFQRPVKVGRYQVRLLMKQLGLTVNVSAYLY